MRTAVAVVAALLAGASLLRVGTDGFRVLTAEGARRLAATERPEPLPSFELRDREGRTFRLRELPGEWVLVEFFYARCATLCNALGETFAVVRDRLPAGVSVTLVSVSLDPRDAASDLRAYGARFGDPPGGRWRVARLDDRAEIPRMLDAFGVTAIADGLGGFEHNAAVHVVDGEGRLVEIVDHDPPAAALEAVRRRL